MLVLFFFVISYVVAQYTLATLSDGDKLNIVKYHNAARKNWGTPALKNLNAICGWNDTLAQRAGTVAAKCKWVHSTNDDRTYGADQYGNPLVYGENMAQGTGVAGQSFPYWTYGQFVDMWKGEEKDWDCTKTASYDFATGASEDGCRKGIDPASGLNYMCGHFTQVIWVTTTEVGCAVVDCPAGSPINPSGKVEYMVCQYAPGGNGAGSHPLDPAGGQFVWNSDMTGVTAIKDSWSQCPDNNKVYRTTPSVTALTAEGTAQDTTNSAHSGSQIADEISIPMGAFITVAVICSLIVFLGVLIVIAFIVMVRKNNNNDSKAMSLL